MAAMLVSLNKTILNIFFCQTAEYGFGAPEIYFGAVLGAPKVHYVIILDSLARRNPPIRFLPPICTVQLSAVYVDLWYHFILLSLLYSVL